MNSKTKRANNQVNSVMNIQEQREMVEKANRILNEMKSYTWRDFETQGKFSKNDKLSFISDDMLIVGGRFFMNIDESVFAFKLYELEEQYGKLQCRVRVCEEGGRDKIHSELQKAEDEFEENTLLLKEKVKSCRSGAVAKLSQAQLDYRQKIEEMKKQLVKDLHSDDSSPEEDEKEAGMLYAEFAMDFATLSVQQALISALRALDSRKSAVDEKKGETEECRK